MVRAIRKLQIIFKIRTESRGTNTMKFQTPTQKEERRKGQYLTYIIVLNDNSNAIFNAYKMIEMAVYSTFEFSFRSFCIRCIA